MKLPNTPCCKYVRAFFKWLWNFLFAGKRFFLNFILLPLLTAWVICLLWGYYTSDLLVFNPLYYPYLPQKERLTLVCMIAYVLFTIIYALIMQRARSERPDCSIRNIHIARLARLWLDDDEIKSQALEANEAWRNEQMERIEAEAANRTLIVSTEIAGRFIRERLTTYLKRFSNEEIEILRFLLNLLEIYGNVPSVASKYRNDYDIKQFKYRNGSKDIPITSDGKTSYWILSTYSLLNHTIRVASLIIEEIKSRTNAYSILMPKAIISALAHDIGKIKTEAIGIDEEVAKATDHPYLSAMIIKERFPEYVNIDEIVSIVQEHHLPIDKSGSVCAIALKAADQKARREEIKRWFIKTYGSEAKSPDPYHLNLTIGADTDLERIKRDGQPDQTEQRTNQANQTERSEQALPTDQSTQAKQTRQTNPLNQPKQSNQSLRSQTGKIATLNEIEPITTAVYTDEGLEGENGEGDDPHNDRDGIRELDDKRNGLNGCGKEENLIDDGDYDGRNEQSGLNEGEGKTNGYNYDKTTNAKAPSRVVVEMPPIFADEYGGEYDEQTGEWARRPDERQPVKTPAAKEKDNNGSKYGDNDKHTDDDGKIAGNSSSQPKPLTAKPKPSQSKSKSKFGETRTPKYPQSGDNDYRTLEFDLQSCEEAILDRLRTEPIAIDRSGVNMFVPALNIGSIPCNNVLLVSFARLTGFIGSIFISSDNNGELDFGAMSRYAVNEWRQRGIVLYIGEGYATRKYEYLYNGEQRKVINVIPFSIEALGLNADDLIERAKRHPLYALIGEMRI